MARNAILLVLALVVATGAIGGRRALAATEAELIAQGVELRRRGKDAEALEKFQQAHAISASPRAKAQMGFAEQALGRWVAAYEHLQAALQAAGDPWIGKNRTTILQAVKLIDDHVGKIEILGGTPGAEVRIDGVPRGTLPLAGALPSSTGTITIELALGGHLPIQRTTIVRSRETVRESFDALRPLPAREPPTVTSRPAAGGPNLGLPPADQSPTASAMASGSSSTSTTSGGGPVTLVETPRDTGDGGGSGSLRRQAKWIAWGLGAAALGVGAYGLVRQRGAAHDFDAGCGIDGAGRARMLPGATTTDAACADLSGQVDSSYRLEVIGVASAALLGGAGLVLWLLEPSAKEAQASAALSCAPGLSGREPSIACGLRF